MSGPYLHGLGRIQARSVSSSFGEESSENLFGNNRYKERHVNPSEAEVIPMFFPEDNCNVTGWLRKIDQLGDIYRWDETDKIIIMQLRIRGAARDWYDRLDDYELSWQEWKDRLSAVFPTDSRNYVENLELMLSRKKNDEETMSKYYYEKLLLLQKCHITGRDAVACIISGLPRELRSNGKAYICETPEQLYRDYISLLENYGQSETHRRKSTRRMVGTDLTTGRVQDRRRCFREQHRCNKCRGGHRMAAAAGWFGALSAVNRDIDHHKHRILESHQKSVRPFSTGRIGRDRARRAE